MSKLSLLILTLFVLSLPVKAQDCPADSVLHIEGTDIKHLYCTFKNITFSSPPDRQMQFGTFIFQADTFRTGVLFQGRRFTNLVMSNCKLTHPLMMRGAVSETCDFQKTTFESDVFFDGYEVEKLAYFGDARFKGAGYFNDLVLNENSVIRFDNAVLPRLLDFHNNIKLPVKIDLTIADFTDPLNYEEDMETFKPILINLFKTDISKIRMDYTHFKLYLPDTMNVGISYKLSFEDKAEMYEALLENFKSHGQSLSYKALDIEYQAFKWKHSKFPIAGPFLKIWNNYGYNREYIFLWTLGFLFYFTLFTFGKLTYLNENVYKVESIPYVPPPLPELARQRFGKRMYYSFVYTSVIFFRLSLKTEKINFKEKKGALYIIIVYTIGVICIAYMANFVIQQ